MSTTPVTSTGTAVTGTTGTQNPNAAAGQLGKDDFLKLFVAQIQNQDPSSPMDTNQSMTQMAQFSMVEQLTNLSSVNTKMATSQANSSAVGLIGHTVSWRDSAGASHSGVVNSVATATDGSPSLTVDGASGVDPSTITQVA